MSRGLQRIHISTEVMRFAAAHMTVFPDGTKERLHGHNFRPKVQLDMGQYGIEDTVPMAVFESAMKSICDSWDEKTLLAERCPFFKILKNDGVDFEFTLCGKHYLVPREEVELLPVDNVSMEALAEEFFRRMISLVSQKTGGTGLDSRIVRVEVTIEGSPGLGASYVWEAKQQAKQEKRIELVG